MNTYDPFDHVVYLHLPVRVDDRDPRSDSQQALHSRTDAETAAAEIGPRRPVSGPTAAA